MMPRNLLLSLLAIGFVVVSGAAKDTDDDTSSPKVNSLTETPSFSVKSRVRNWRYLSSEDQSVHEKSSVKFKSEHHEFYSNEQQRASISFEAQYITSSTFASNIESHTGKLHVDFAANVTLIEDFANHSDKLKSINWEEFRRLLSFHLFNFQLDDFKIPDHIVGPARLLFLVEQNRNRLKFKGLEEAESKKPTDFPSIRYELVGELKSWGKFFLQVIYRQQSEPQGAQARPFPDRVTIYWFNDTLDFSNSTITVDFAQVELNLSPLGAIKLPGQEASGEMVAFDPFVLEPFMGCAQELVAESPLVGAHNLSRFAFRAEVAYYSEHHAPIEFDLFVGHDSGLKSTRVDVSAGEWKILNMKYNRLYHVKSETSELEPDNSKNRVIELVADENDQRDYKPEADCVISRIAGAPPEGSTKTKPIEFILFGGDKFVYLGRAQVRGIDALVYEGETSELPVWLEVPLKESIGIKYSVLLYLGSETNAADMTIPLYMEIYTLDLNLEANKTMTKLYADVHFRDFSWNLNSIIGKNGDQPNRLFSLNGICSHSRDSRAQVEMLLDSNFGSLGQMLLNEPVERDLAILEALQATVGLPIPLISDLEVKIIANKNMTNSLVVAFKIIEHEQMSTRLSEIPLTSMVRYRDSLVLATLEDCLMRAARLKSTLIFGYNAETRQCFLESNVLDMKSGPIAVYKATKEEDAIYPSQVFQLKSKANLMDARSNIIGTVIDLKSFGDFKLMRLELEASEFEWRHKFSNNPNLKRQSKLNSISGLKLTEADGRNTKIDSANYRSESSMGTMTMNECRLICDSDLNCNSYSVCLQGSQVHCTTSIVSFNMSKLSESYEAAVSRKMGAKLYVKLDEQYEMELEYQPTCELRNKDYLSYFSDPLVAGESRFKYPPQPTVIGQEECARRCALQQFEVIRREEDRAEQLTSFILEQAVKSGPDDESSREGDVITSRREGQDKVCFRFMYLDRAKLSARQVVNGPGEGNDDDDAVGYCIFEHNLDAKFDEANGSKWSGIYLVEVYKFKMDLLYEEQYGVSLKATEKSAEEHEAYVKLYGQEADASDYLRAMANFIKRPGNSQTIIPGLDKTACAALCFKQTMAPWPACKSFDVRAAMASQSSWFTCHLNSITLEEAMEGSSGESDIISANETNKRVWHYEPMREFVNVNTNQVLGKMIWLGRKLASLRLIKSFALWTVAIFAISLGCLLGLLLGHQYRARSRLAELRRESTRHIVTRMSTLAKRVADNDAYDCNNNQNQDHDDDDEYGFTDQV